VPTGENAGGIYVTVDADNQPIITKLGQTESIARAAGENIAAGFNEGAAAGDKMTASIVRVGAAATHTVPEISAMSGAIRVLSGEQSIRAIERLGVSVLGLGKAAQAAFPLIGAIAIGELVTRVYERFTKVSDNEKEAAKSAREFTDEIQAADDKVRSLDADMARLRDGAVAGLGVALNNAVSEVSDKVNALQAAKDKLNGPQTVSGVGASGAAVLSHSSRSSQASPEALAAQAANAQLIEALRKVDVAKQELDNARVEAAKKAAKEESDAERDRVALLEASIDHLKDVQRRKEEAQRKADEEDKRRAAAVKSLRESEIRTLEEDGRLMDEQIRTNAESARAASEAASREASLTQRTGQIAAQKTGVGAESANELDKLRAQQQYAEQIVHTKAQEIAYAQQMAAFDEKALQLKISIAQAELIQAVQEQNLIPTREGELKIAEDSLKIEQAKAALAKQQVEDETKIAEMKMKQSLAGQIIGKVGTGPGSIADAANIQIANTTATAIDGISAALGRAAQGGQNLSKIFQQLGKSVLGEVVSGIAKIGLQMLTTALVGKAAGSAIAVAEVTSAAAVGAANAAAATAAIPIIGPELAPAVAAATFAEIMAFAPLASYDKGGPIKEDQIARVHKGEYVLTADQAAGKVAIPTFTGGGAVGSTPFTNSMAVNSSSAAFSVGAIHLHGVRDMQDVARRLPNVLKAASSRFQPASS
jgi:hypothetical protein